MTFEEFWAEVEKLRVLPEMAIVHIPMSLSAESKKKLMKAGPQKCAKMLKSAIEEINHGSIESIDEIVNQYCV